MKYALAIRIVLSIVWLCFTGWVVIEIAQGVVFRSRVAPAPPPYSSPQIVVEPVSTSRPFIPLDDAIATGAANAAETRAIEKQSCVSWKDAAKYVGQTLCVTGVVYAAYFEDPDNNYSPFIISFDPVASFYLESYGERLWWKGTNLVGQCVEVLGTVSRNTKGQVRMTLNSHIQVDMCQ